ncbi:MAG: KamA family radical SAM protein, partial [Candidatus Brocadiia bacterium]
IRVYPDRVAFCVGNRCPVYCRHCLRKERMVGKPDVNFSDEKIQEGIDYIRNDPDIRDVLLTGGDPLLMSDDRVAHLLEDLRAIDHVEVLRIGSRTPCTLPQRITPELCDMLENFHPLYLNTQFNHPKEITPEAKKACARLAGAGIPLGNQSVLLKGINDNAEVMKNLCQKLMGIRVRPYYIYQCQILSGTRHLRTPIECGREIIRQLQGFTSGLAVPKFVVDTPYGKIPVSPNYAIGREEDKFVMKSWNGKVWREPNPLPESGAETAESSEKHEPETTCTQCPSCCVCA